MNAPAWRAFQLLPDDVLFFRDGKPSSIGQDHYLRSLFPPFPSTLYGALRTHRLLKADVDLSALDSKAWGNLPGNVRAELGEWGDFGTLSLRGPWITQRRNGKMGILFPAPHDLGLVMKQGDSGGLQQDPTEPEFGKVETVVRFLPHEPIEGETRWSHPLTLLRPHALKNGEYRPWVGEEDPTIAVGWYVTEAGMRSWLDGYVPDREEFVKQNELWRDEVRTGVALQKEKRCHQEHQLYTFGFVRLMPGVGIGFEVSDDGSLESRAHLRFGGDGRTARTEAGPSMPAFGTPAGPRFTIYLATPCLSEEGAYAPGFSENRVDASLNGVPVRLVAASVKGSVLVGGWDLANKRAKPLRRAIPAGAVYHFTRSTDASPSADGAFSISGYGSEHLTKQGFGLVLAGHMKGSPDGK